MCVAKEEKKVGLVDGSEGSLLAKVVSTRRAMAVAVAVVLLLVQ